MDDVELKFKHFIIDDQASIAMNVSDGNCCGIYIYRFDDGTFYVGQSKDVRKRYTQHRSEYRHMAHRLKVEEIWFSPIHEEDLNKGERFIIKECQNNGISLRNKMLTSLPMGYDPIEIKIEGEGAGILLPWERALRSKDEKYDICIKDTEAERSKFEAFINHSRSFDALEVLHSYVSQTIPSPSKLGGRLWTISCMPSTNKNSRLCTLSIGNLETLVIGRKDNFGCFLNLKPDNIDRMIDCICTFEDAYYYLADYKESEDVITVFYEYEDNGLDLIKMKKLLSDDIILDACYQLNVELMRKGMHLHTRFNNRTLMNEIIRRKR